MLQMCVRGICGTVLLNESVIFIHPHFIRIRKNIDFAAVTSRMLPNIHGRTQFQHRLFLLLARIDYCRQFRIAEHIHDSVITDAVTTSKILVGVVIKHAPAKASCNVLLGCHRIQNICMAERMLCPVFFPVKCLRRIHMPIVFTDEVCFFHI